MYAYKLTYKEGSFKCRLCPTSFLNPEELRTHAMVKHKGHILVIKR